VEVAVNTGCVLFKEGDYEGAAAKFKEAAALDSGNPVRREADNCTVPHRCALLHGTADYSAWGMVT
jgi:hypothetical protein